MTRMTFGEWIHWGLPVWTFFLGQMIGGLDGGVARLSNWGAILFYLVLTVPVGLLVEFLTRRYADPLGHDQTHGHRRP